LSSPAASFRFTGLLWQHLKPIMSSIQEKDFPHSIAFSGNTLSLS
jgi:hypothetical protein